MDSEGRKRRARHRGASWGRKHELQLLSQADCPGASACTSQGWAKRPKDSWVSSCCNKKLWIILRTSWEVPICCGAVPVPILLGFIPNKGWTNSSWLAAGKTRVDELALEKRKKVVFNDVTDKVPWQKWGQEGPEGNQTSTYRGWGSGVRAWNPSSTDCRGRFPHAQR